LYAHFHDSKIKTIKNKEKLIIFFNKNFAFSCSFKICINDICASRYWLNLSWLLIILWQCNLIQVIY